MSTQLISLDKGIAKKNLTKDQIISIILKFGPEPTERLSYIKKDDLLDTLNSMSIELPAFVEHLLEAGFKSYLIKEILPEFADAVDLVAGGRKPKEPLKRFKDHYNGKYEGAAAVRGLVNPTMDDDFVIKPSTMKLFEHILNRGSSGINPENVLMVGPQGCGKTETALQFAAHSGLPLLKLNCALIREPRDWFGYKTAEAGSVSWIRSEFCKLVERGGGVILLDEISRAAPPILNSLMPLLDGTGQTFLEEVKEVVRRGPDLFFFSTANIGNQFTGTYGKLDSALNDRFAIRIECDYLPSDEETNLLIKRTGLDSVSAIKLVNVATKIRQSASGALGSTLSSTVSTRNLLDAAVLYRSLGHEAFEYTILPIFSKKGGSGSQQAQVLQIIQSQFGA